MTSTRAPSPAGLDHSVVRPELPEIDIEVDLDADAWHELGARFLELAVDASTGWDALRPAANAEPDEVARRLGGDMPERGLDPRLVADRMAADLLPLSSYNGHPRWFGYITAAPSPVGVLGSLVEAALNQNTAMWRLAPGATTVELQVIEWVRRIVGLPPGTEGIFSSGGQMANVIAHLVARDRKAGWDVRALGVRGPEGAPALRLYASDESHYCHEAAAELAGLGRDAIRLVPTDDAYRLRLDSLASMVAEDRARGFRPITVVATAGTVRTGAVDPIEGIIRFARDEDLWVHVDGAYGAFATLAESAPPELGAMGEADSVACDPHKWLYAPIDAAITLVRERGALERSFAFHVPYLHAGEDESDRVDILERSPENTRPFRALKVWLAMQVYGRDGYGALIERDIRLAAYLEALVQSTPGLVLAAPRELSVVCWRAEPEGLAGDVERLNRLQDAISHELEARGIAVVSVAPLRGGRSALRACIVNFRTGVEDVEALVRASRDLADELAASI
jgi:aromatic-L-amino-acid decarboxylase